jgi:hypothetical protein
MAESNIMRRMWMALSNAGSTLFRNNVALAVVGRVTYIKEVCAVRLGPGDAVVRNARPLHAGLIKGSGDLIGWTEVVVTPEMVGTKIAIFTSIESKDGTKSTEDQVKWRRNVQRAGGFAGEARNDVEALAIIGK